MRRDGGGQQGRVHPPTDQFLFLLYLRVADIQREMSDPDYFFARVDPFGGGPVVDDLYQGATGSQRTILELQRDGATGGRQPISDALAIQMSQRHARAHAERSAGVSQDAQLAYWAALDHVVAADLELAAAGNGRFVVASGGGERAHASAVAQYVLVTLALVSDAERAHNLQQAADLIHRCSRRLEVLQNTVHHRLRSVGVESLAALVATAELARALAVGGPAVLTASRYRRLGKTLRNPLCQRRAAELEAATMTAAVATLKGPRERTILLLALGRRAEAAQIMSQEEGLAELDNLPRAQLHEAARAVLPPEPADVPLPLLSSAPQISAPGLLREDAWFGAPPRPGLPTGLSIPQMLELRARAAGADPALVATIDDWLEERHYVWHFGPDTDVRAVLVQHGVMATPPAPGNFLTRLFTKAPPPLTFDAWLADAKMTPKEFLARADRPQTAAQWHQWARDPAAMLMRWSREGVWVAQLGAPPDLFPSPPPRPSPSVRVSIVKTPTTARAPKPQLSKDPSPEDFM